MELGTFLSNRRKQLGLSLSDVGAALGYTPQAIHRYEKGIVKIDLSLVEHFCRVLNLSLSSFFRMDLESSKPYNGEKFNSESFCIVLTKELSKDTSLCKKIASKLDTSTIRIEKWANGSSLPTVDEFLVLSKILNYDPINLYLGSDIKQKVPYHIKWKIPLVATMGIVVVSICISVPIILSQRLNEDIPTSSSSSDSLVPAKEKCLVTIQGYDYDDFSIIDSIHYEYNVYKGDVLPSFNAKSPYYDYVCSWVNGEEFSYADTPIEEDITVQALFSKKTFTVAFLGYNDEIISTSKTRYLSSAVAPTEIEDQGDFRFVKWKEDFSCVKQDLLIHSIFSRFRCNLSLDFAGGSENEKSSEAILGYTMDSFDSLPKPQKKGHKFIGYFDQDGVLFDKNYQMDDESISLHAAYEPLKYKIIFEGLNKTQEVTFGEEVTSLPTQDDSNDILLGWEKGNERVTLPFVYDDDFDITLSPIHASAYFSYTLKDEKVEINSLKQWGEPEIDLTCLGNYPISKITTNAISNNESIKSITLNQSQVELESACFDNLSNLSSVYFNNVDSSSVFHEGIFNNCSKITYIRSGSPLKEDQTPMKLKEYGIKGSKDLTYEFNESTKAYPNAWSEGFDVLGELRLGNGIEGKTSIISNGCKILHFIPGKTSYPLINLELPDLDQDELRFYGTSLVKIDGDKFGKVKKFIMKNGGVSVSNRSKPLEVDEFDMSCGQIIALRNQTIKANKISLSDCVYEGYFAPLDNKLQIDFYGCSSLPSGLTSYSPFLDINNTSINFHSEKLYDENKTVDYPFSIDNW